MVQVGEVKKALAMIDGASFANREQLENAVYPLFGPLQAAMSGLSFRDLVDLLLDKGWARHDRSKGMIVVRFPPTPTLVQVPPNEPEETSDPSTWSGPHVPQSDLTFREIALLVHLHNYYKSSKDMGFESLVAKKLVEQKDLAPALSEQTIAELKQNIMAAKTKILNLVSNDNFNDALALLFEVQEAQTELTYKDVVYQLTQKGKDFMNVQPDSYYSSFMNVSDSYDNSY